MRKKLFLATAVLVSLGLASCGGGGSSSVSTTLTGQFVDSEVANVEYETSSGITGRTDENGYFKYRPGDTVVFKVGKVVIGETKGQDLVTLVDLLSDDTTDPAELQKKMELISAFLISLDEDGNPDNGIKIKEEAIEKLKDELEEEVDLEKEEHSADVDVVSLVDNLPIPEDLREEVKDKITVAENHIEKSVYQRLGETLQYLDGKTVLLKSKDGSINGTCTFTITSSDENAKTITGEITNCSGSGVEDDAVTFKVEEGIPYLYEGDGTKDMIIELEHEEFCIMTPDSGVICMEPYEEEHEEHAEASEVTAENEMEGEHEEHAETSEATTESEMEGEHEELTGTTEANNESELEESHETSSTVIE
ncbi:hypothetical protein [Phorcysia thermohydrogeniphila]|uniref:Uncharacterized protein n=1 Tax=Phorcysia thermohydrogeniphila TaxID=936138 RepID=A0A4R1GCU0_9BACT|nr:hypothetical protein [Phorcysia thermohydrogeniphila]TCK04581.1 hypothetical protein CLV27_1014 [Phorcysia thermohydrogeniphila]